MLHQWRHRAALPTSSEPMHVAFVISSLSAGGAEKVMAVIANFLADRDYAVTLVTLADERSDFYPLSPHIRRIGLGLVAPTRNVLFSVVHNLRRLKQLRRTLRLAQPDVVVSFMDTTNVLALLASLGTNVPVIVSERTDPAHHRIPRSWSALRVFLYGRADAVVVQSEGARRWVEAYVCAGRVHVIPNPLVSQSLGLDVRPKSASTSSRPDRFVVGVGRLAPEKGFDRLVRAFAQCVPKFADWSLVILGEGDERSRLETLVTRLGVAARVTLPGAVKDPSEILRAADLFVLSSRYEGFPNALLEAMDAGLPVISFDCPSGPREIIRDGVDGLLVPAEDVDALASAMRRLMADEGEREMLGLRAREVSERFGFEKVMTTWEGLLRDVARRRAA